MLVERKPGTKSVYVGESGRSILVRGRQHIDALESPEKHADNAFVKHSNEYHAGENPEYKVSLVGSYPRPLQRQVMEGVLIRKYEIDNNVLMNSKMDHYAPAVGRMTISNAVNEPNA